MDGTMIEATISISWKKGRPLISLGGFSFSSKYAKLIL